MSGGDAPKGSPVHSYFPLDSNDKSQVVQDLFSISRELPGIRIAPGPPISLVIPDKTVDLLAQEVFQVVRMRVIYHILVGHGVRVAQNESVMLQVIQLILILRKNLLLVI